ncbi:hypothetical protein [Haliangium sp.]|uniref:hypothetical protein n=1 Tax=Haliangium sp. TaxID=2663208 RepID=UPI003D0A0180
MHDPRDTDISSTAASPAQRLYAEVCHTVANLPVFAPWAEGRPRLDELSGLEPGYVLEGPEVSRGWLEQQYQALADADKARIADHWEKLLNSFEIANEVALTAMQCALDIGQALGAGGEQAFAEQETDVLAPTPRPATEAAAEPFDEAFEGEASLYARVAAMALWKTSLRPWQAMMGGLVVTVGLLTAYLLMDHVDAMTTPIAMDEVAPLEIEPNAPETSPAAAAVPALDQSPSVSRDLSTPAQRPRKAAEPDKSDATDEPPADTSATPRRAEKRAPSAEKLVGPGARATVSMGQMVQHVVLTPENADVAEDTAITIAVKPGLPREVEGTTRATRHFVIPDVEEFSLQLDIDSDLMRSPPTTPPRQRTLRLVWSNQDMDN